MNLLYLYINILIFQICKDINILKILTLKNHIKTYFLLIKII